MGSERDWDRADGWLPGRWLSGIEGVVVDPRAGPNSAGSEVRAPASAEPQQSMVANRSHGAGHSWEITALKSRLAAAREPPYFAHRVWVKPAVK